MGRRLLYTLGIAALGAAAFWLGRPGPPEDLGLVVHVYVKDAQGKPLENAQAERLFDPGWQVVDRDGYRRLTHVRLRADETDPTAEAVSRSVRIRAPFFTLREGFAPEITQRADGAWDARYMLHHHGVLRVHVKGTHLGDVKAYLEPDKPLQRLEAMDRGNVARPGEPAAFRVYPGLEHVVVRVVGEPDPQGVIAVATRRHFIEPPGPGHIVEKTLVPGVVEPIVGTLQLPGEPIAPRLGGSVRIVELAPGGRRVERGSIPLELDGSFVVRDIGAGRYELHAQLDFMEPCKPVVVEGGGSVDLPAPKARPWIVIHHPGLDGGARKILFHIGKDDARLTRRLATHTEGETSYVAWHALFLGKQVVRLDAPGTHQDPPLTGRAELEITGPGPSTVTVEPSVAPHGSITVRIDSPSLTSARGADVVAGHRRQTLLPKLQESVTFKHLAVGRDLVYVEWRDADSAFAAQEVTVAAGADTAVTFTRSVGGSLEMHATGRNADALASEVNLDFGQTGSPYGGAHLGVLLTRSGPAPRWEGNRALLPGRYVATVQDWDDSGLPEQFEFVIRAGETTVLPFEAK